MTSESLTVVTSSFDPSGQLLASVIPSLDVHKLRIHSISGGSNEGPQISEYSLDRGNTVQCLKWVSSSKNLPKKKRKRVSGVDGTNSDLEDLLVVLGTNKGSILLYSPSTGSLIGTLNNGHSLPITGLSTSNNSIWSCDSNGTICEWNISKKSLLRSFTSSESDINLVYPSSIENQLLLASTNVFLVDLASSAASKLPKSAIIKNFPGFIHPISDIIFPTSNQDLFLCSSKTERNVNLFSIAQGKPSGIFISQSDVESIVLNEDDSALAVVTDDGLIEIFISPLQVSNGTTSNSNSRRSRGKSLTSSTKSSIQIKICRPSPSKELVKVNQVIFHDDYVTVNWLENASIPVFEQIRWKDETTGKPLSGLIEITKARRVPGIDDISNKSANGADVAAPTTYNEAKSIVTSGKDVQNLESDDEEEDDEGTLADRLDALNTNTNNTGSKLNGSVKSSAKSIPKAEFSTPGSFAVILNQALRTNDRALLESCLVNRDEVMVKVSVQRLDSSLAVTFLERLAEKLARSPSRAGQLNIWIKWVMISHGGYLVTLPNLLKTLSSLHSTVSERVTTLPRLLALQGRLELLNSQMEIRRDLLAESRKAELDDNEEEDEAAVEYVEDRPYIMNGEEDFEDDEDDEDGDDKDDEDIDDVSAFANGNLKDDYDEDIIMGEDDEGYSDLEAVETFADEDDEEEIEELVSKTTSSSKKTNGRIRR